MKLNIKRQLIAGLTLFICIISFSGASDKTDEQVKIFHLRYAAERYLLNHGFKIIKAVDIVLPVSLQLLDKQILDINSGFYQYEDIDSIGQYESYYIDAILFEYGNGNNGSNTYVVVPKVSFFASGLAYAKFDFSGNIKSIIGSDGQEVDLTYNHVCSLNEYLACFPLYDHKFRAKITVSIINSLN